MTRIALSDLEYTADVPALPLGPEPGADTRTRSKAVLYSWDAAGRLATLADAETGGAGSVVPVVGDYDWANLLGQPLWVLRDAISGRHILALGPVVPPSTSATGQVTAVSSDGVTVQASGRQVLASTLAGAAPAVGDTVALLWASANDPWVIGVVGTRATHTPPPNPTPTEPQDVTRTITLTPTWSGTWRAGYGWDAWQLGSDTGGRSTLYQGQSAGSGRLVGLATYGDRIASLRADEITSASLVLRLAADAAPAPVHLQGAPHSARPVAAPAPAGSVVAAAPFADGLVRVELPAAVRSALASGAARSLALVGTDYTAVRGTSAADGMALTIVYRKRA